MPAPFLLDSNFFIQAHRMHYPIDVVPSFWGRVVDLANNGLVISIDKVYSELAMGRDDLYGWCAGFEPVECVNTIEMFRRLGQTF